MNKIPCLTALFFAVALAACNHKPKPVSNNITKTTVTVEGHKDSVINNPQKNYGTATISEPCTKLLLENIQGSSTYRDLVSDKLPADIKYTVNWVEAEEPKICTNGTRITNGIEVAVSQNVGKNKVKIGSYIYNNEDAKLYYINNGNQYDEVTDVNATALKKIRNGCYWGVASHK